MSQCENLFDLHASCTAFCQTVKNGCMLLPPLLWKPAHDGSSTISSLTRSCSEKGKRELRRRQGMVGRVAREESGVSVKGIKCRVNPENLLQFANGVPFQWIVWNSAQVNDWRRYNIRGKLMRGRCRPRHLEQMHSWSKNGQFSALK